MTRRLADFCSAECRDRWDAPVTAEERAWAERVSRCECGGPLTEHACSVDTVTCAGVEMMPWAPEDDDARRWVT